MIAQIGCFPIMGRNMMINDYQALEFLLPTRLLYRGLEFPILAIRRYGNSNSRNKRAETQPMKWKNLYEANRIFFFTSRITEQVYILRTDSFKQILIDTLLWYIDKYQISIYGYVIMDNHFHLLLSAPSARGLQQFIQHTLRKSSIRIVAALQYYAGIQAEPPEHVTNLAPYNPKYAERAQEILHIFASHARGKAQHAVWKEQARGVPIQTEKSFGVRLNYIHMNPVRAGMVMFPEAYAFSSFRSIYFGETVCLPISLPEWR